VSEPDRRIRRIAIVGGGLSGWTAAATLARKLGGHSSIHVVDSAEVVTPGLAAATQPSFLDLLRFLGIEQNDFVDKTQSTYCLGRRVSDWVAGQTFWHPFGAFGASIERRPFYHYWHKARALGLKPRPELFSLETSMTLANRFIFPTNSLGVAQHMRYALHVDVGLAIRYMRAIAERAGVIRLERKVVGASRREDGFLAELKFEDGGSLNADLFVDCTGARAQLIGEFLEVPFDDWKQLLPCDRLVVAPVALEEVRQPCVRIAARPAGWQWRMPLQQSASVGYVYASEAQDDEAARQDLVNTAGEPIAEPRSVKFTNGRRVRCWDKNVVALGAAAGTLEPLGGTDLHMIGVGIFNLLDHFPDRQFDAVSTASYNAAIADDIERNRDFVVLHYNLSRRDDTPFWQQRSQVTVPENVASRVAMYRATGRVMQRAAELFTDLDWFWVMEGLGVTPRDYDPLVDTVDFEQVKRLMMAISQKVSADTAAAPTHDSFFAAANARLAGARKTAAQS
jgi:tryptophan halogenase